MGEHVPGWGHILRFRNGNEKLPWEERAREGGGGTAEEGGRAGGHVGSVSYVTRPHGLANRRLSDAPAVIHSTCQSDAVVLASPMGATGLRFPHLSVRRRSPPSSGRSLWGSGSPPFAPRACPGTEWERVEAIAEWGRHSSESAYPRRPWPCTSVRTNSISTERYAHERRAHNFVCAACDGPHKRTQNSPLSALSHRLAKTDL
ncbi:hypothetical protein C2E23DRAFT_223180 [Lenzites betulinus]|nr:hypothetical protein C2E23DRAFT_223180 [Lenzites betulinus]